ncbi:MAG: hypothetical protein H6597_01320 [Flavobacteriales bacterium]|nr:hypothetical protein [Flavobacteriales bacterium]
MRRRAACPGDKGEEDKDKDKGGNKEENKFNILETLARMKRWPCGTGTTYSQNSGYAPCRAMDRRRT